MKFPGIDPAESSSGSTPGLSHGLAKPTRGTLPVHDADNSENRPFLRISETFTSRQGEGTLTGTESFFIRTTGCNLRCWFCDTPYASWQPEGAPMSIESLVNNAALSGTGHVVLTGGEPLLPLQTTELCTRLRAAGMHVTIETAGTVDRDAACDLLSLSPKLRSSTPESRQEPRWSKLHEQRRMPIDVMRRLIDRSDSVQVKFVVDSPADFDEILAVTANLDVSPQSVWLMPQGITTAELQAAAEWLRPWCIAHSLTYGDRMQIHWYGNRRGT